MRSHSSAAWKKTGRIWSLSAALLLVTMFAWMSSAVATPASGDLLGEHATVDLSVHGMHHAAPDDCFGDAGATEGDPCAPVPACAFCAPLEAVPLDCGLPDSELLAPGAPRCPAGVTVLPPDYPPRSPSPV